MTPKPNIFFTSDLHFDHRSILTFTNPRLFATIEEHDEKIIANWNSVVKPGDVVYVIGDVSLRGSPEVLRDRLSRLNGCKHLILGNHDKAKVHSQFLNENIWQSMRDIHTVKTEIDGEQWFIKLSHFPILEFDGAYRKNTMHLYGHIHNITNYDDIYKKLGFKALHVGVDTSDCFPNTAKYTPIKLEDIIARSNQMFGTDCAHSAPRYRGDLKQILKMQHNGVYRLENGHVIRLVKNTENKERPWKGIIVNIDSSYECYQDYDEDGKTEQKGFKIVEKLA